MQDLQCYEAMLGRLLRSQCEQVVISHEKYRNALTLELQRRQMLKLSQQNTAQSHGNTGQSQPHLDPSQPYVQPHSAAGMVASQHLAHLHSGHGGPTDPHNGAHPTSHVDLIPKVTVQPEMQTMETKVRLYRLNNRNKITK